MLSQGVHLPAALWLSLLCDPVKSDDEVGAVDALARVSSSGSSSSTDIAIL